MAETPTRIRLRCPRLVRVPALVLCATLLGTSGCGGGEPRVPVTPDPVDTGLHLPIEDYLLTGKQAKDLADDIMRHADQGVIDGLVTMGVELTDHVADDAGGFLVALARIELEQAHGVDDAAVHGLETVARIGQRPLGDGGQGIGEVPLLKGLLEIDDALVVGRREGIAIRHRQVFRENESGKQYSRCRGKCAKTGGFARVWTCGNAALPFGLRLRMMGGL